MTVYFVGAGPGDPELLTCKAERLIRSCKVCIYAGSLVSPAVVSLIPKEAQAHDSAHLDLPVIIALCKTAHVQGLDVVRLHTGDPCLYSAINEQMDELNRWGIDYRVVPGVSAYQAAAAVLQRELTAPEVAQTVILSRTAGRTPMPADESLQNLARSRATLCLFLSIHKIGKIAAELSDFYGSDCPVAVVYHASWPDQQVLTGTLADIAQKTGDAGIAKTALILVGRSLSLGAERSKLYAADFAHGYRVGSAS